MKNTMSILLIASLLIFMLLSSSCIMDKKIIEIVVNGSTCVNFDQDEQDESFVKNATVDLAEEVQDILDKSGYSRDRLLEAKLIGGSYEVTQYSQDEVWELSGSVDVTRLDILSPPYTLYAYTTQEISSAVVGKTFKMELEQDGVDVINKALNDFINGANPVIRVRLQNGDVNPNPSASKPLVFTWKACIRMYVVVSEEIEVPDPF